jgi:hypothetical protein
MSGDTNLEMKELLVNCICSDLGHLTRLIYDPEDKQFYIEVQLSDYPGKVRDVVTTFKPGEGAVKIYVKTLWHNVKRFQSYLKNIWWSIKGRPVWFSANLNWGHEEALKTAAFLLENVKDWPSDKQVTENQFGVICNNVVNIYDELDDIRKVLLIRQKKKKK